MKKLLIIIILFIGAGVWLASQILDSQALVAESGQGSVESAQQVKKLMRKIHFKSRTPPRKFSLRISAQELDAIGGFAHRAIPRLRLQTNLSQDAANVVISAALPGPLQGNFFNSQVLVLSSTSGVLIDRVTLGGLSFEQPWSINLLIGIADLLTDDLFSNIINQITHVRIQTSDVTLAVNPTDPLRQQLNQVAAVFGLEDNDNERESIRHYYQFLVGLSSRLPERRNLSLLSYLKPLMLEAASRSDSSNAAEENRTALLALGYFAGHRHFAGVIGNFAGLENKPARIPHQLLLAGRHDLQQHFLYSIIFKLLSDRGVSDMLGELKELMDSGRGGSGFSFADLAADLSGNQFAQYATDKATARLLQAGFAGKVNERWIIPKVDDLDEGLSKQDFKTQYGEVDSPRYNKVVAEIHARIARLPLYKASATKYKESVAQ